MRWMTLLALLLGLSIAVGGAGDLSAGHPEHDDQPLVEKARLQAVMRRYIEQQAIDGALLHLDFEAGQVLPLYPTRAHPMIFTMGEHFVLCTDLTDGEGRNLPLDLYIAAKNRGYAVFKAEIGNRAPLKKLMQDGLVRRLP